MATNRDQADKQDRLSGRKRVDSVDQQQQGQPYSGEQSQDNREVRDISDIDQQEGNMNNGTLGGDLDTNNSDAEADVDRNAS